MSQAVYCGNCNWKGFDDDEWFTPLGLCCDLTERPDPGSEVPAGGCPECRSFCYIDDLTPPANHGTIVLAE